MICSFCLYLPLATPSLVQVNTKINHEICYQSKGHNYFKEEIVARCLDRRLEEFIVPPKHKAFVHPIVFTLRIIILNIL